MSQFISVKGARVHNLKNIDVKIPRGKLTVVTGISGSGKSSLAFDTIFAEGQRRYVESLSSYARQFLGVMEKPDVDEITGLSPALAIDQKSASRSPRSTVGTMSDIYDFFRLLYASIGKLTCQDCNEPMTKIPFATIKQQSSARTCWLCKNGHSAPEMTISTFSFNSPSGACPECQGLGKKLKVRPDQVAPNQRLTLSEGAIRPWTRINAGSTGYQKILEDLSRAHNFSLNTPFSQLPQSAYDAVLFGSAITGFEGVVANLERRHGASDSEYVRQEIEKYMARETCPVCQGGRLKKEALQVRVAGKNIVEISDLAIEKLCLFVDNLNQNNGLLTKTESAIAQGVIQETKRRLNYMLDVGISYLTLSRPSNTLAGGETQRIRLAAQLGSKLMGVIYILDEPSIGLHPRDHAKLIKILKQLRDCGNTVIVVEHDRQTIEASDHIIDVGPGAGEKGGLIVAEGTARDIKKLSGSLTAEYLNGKQKIIFQRPRRALKNFIVVKGASEFNLKNLTVKIPTEQFVCVTGVSGSGKSTLVTDILAAALKRHFYRAATTPGKHDAIKGIEFLNKVIEVDQSPIGRTPRSNPATYTGVFGPLRELFANVEMAKKRRYAASQFSFNLRSGRCENCRGDGVLKVDMHFLPTVYVQCEACGGSRYKSETLDVLYKDKSIADVLDMTVDEASDFFNDSQDVMGKLTVLKQVGLGYIRLGQSATTLSGGEAQRVKLATQLSRPQADHTLYILDEPTTGLHFDDIKKLLAVLHWLVDKGNTVLVVEHNLDVIKNADWVIDLGPEGGDKGGYLVAQGTPKDIAKVEKSYTGQFLKQVL